MNNALIAASLLQVSQLAINAVEMWQRGAMSDEELAEFQKTMRNQLNEASENLDQLIMDLEEAER